MLTVDLLVFFLYPTASTKIYTLSLHDALPILIVVAVRSAGQHECTYDIDQQTDNGNKDRDRKSTRLNSSHLGISYAVFCLKKKRHRVTGQSYRSGCIRRCSLRCCMPYGWTCR